MKYFSGSVGRRSRLRPPDLYEYSIDNYWFRSVGFEAEASRPRLKGTHQADVVIIGGGFTGLAAAYQIRLRFPEKRIVLLEGARCGYGASGRNGGFCVSTEWTDGLDSADANERRKALKVAGYGLRQIKHLITEHGLDCDLEETGMLDVALTDKQVSGLATAHEYYAEIGLESTLLEGAELEGEIRSPVFKAGLVTPYGAILNPAKLVLGMRDIAEDMGVEIKERTLVTGVTPGRTVVVDTELGEIRSPILVVATNAYSHKLGFFRNRVLPVAVFQIATEPLTPSQWDSTGWTNRRGLADTRALFSYLRPTADGRIVMGGVDSQYYSGDSLTSGNDKAVSRKIEAELLRFFPGLEGLAIEHAWGGTTALTVGNTPSVGVVGEDRNVFYGVGFSEGIPSTQAAGRMIADLMAGESNEFTSHRVINHGIPWAGPTALRGPMAGCAKWLMRTFDLPLYR